ncbi:MAG: hypothetical protein VX836_20225 [Pseudomonadota bacterium]|jgi:hypothetical protein|nr:hypothetical protein [Pseudomonadota bacterium]
MKHFTLVLAVGALSTVSGLVSAQVCAAERNDVPSCRQYASIPDEAPSRTVFVLVDRTTVLDQKLSGDAVLRVKRTLSSGERVVIVAFSSFQAEQYTEVVFDGRLDRPLKSDERYVLPKRDVGRYEHCVSKQQEYFENAVGSAMDKVLAAPITSARNSDLVGSLSQISKELIGAAPAKSKTVLLISDLLEHSSVTSFYAQQKLRQIDPTAEFKKFKALDLIGAFDDANIFVLGAGLLPGDESSYRGQEKLMALKMFWTQYFDASNAHLVAWGEPALLVDLY